MKLDPILEQMYQKFDVNPEIKNDVEKYLSKEQRWDIVTHYYRSIEKDLDCAISLNANTRMITFIFKDKEAAKKFAYNPSDELQKFSRNFLIQRGQDPKKYDLFFNLNIVYDESENNKKPLVVNIRVI